MELEINTGGYFGILGNTEAMGASIFRQTMI